MSIISLFCNHLPGENENVQSLRTEGWTDNRQSEKYTNVILVQVCKKLIINYSLKVALRPHKIPKKKPDYNVISILFPKMLHHTQLKQRKTDTKKMFKILIHVFCILVFNVFCLRNNFIMALRTSSFGIKNIEN